MARAIWKGLVNFGLVNIPIELHTATRDHMPKFRLLHRKDMSPISMERICQTDGKPVAWSDLVKGYEVERGHFVALTEDDFKTAARERSRSIEITAFVPVNDIDVRYWDKPYYASPSKGAEQTYLLLARALEKSGRAGIAKYVMRQRQHLVALVPLGDQLIVSTLRFPADLIAMPEKKSKAKVAARELTLAGQLIEGMAEPWQPDKYSDDYVKALMEVIDTKAEGGKVKRPAGVGAPERTNVVDLVARLKESLAAAEKKAPAARSGARRAKRTTRTAKRKRSAA